MHTISAGDLEATFVPAAGMVCSSLRHRGEEVLGQRAGLEGYRERGSSFGIPLLAPWANRLGGLRYGDVELDPAAVKLDANGLPIHGLLTASPLWEVEDARAQSISARLEFGTPELLASFPFPHRLTVTAVLTEQRLSIATELIATGDADVPVSFGWHPYLAPPGEPRERWLVELPVQDRAVLDEHGIPIGTTEPAGDLAGPLGTRDLDDLFPHIALGHPFAVEAGGRRIEVVFEQNYPVAQVYAPADEQFICFEPMTAPTNALVSGDGLRWVAPGDGFEARFSIAFP